MFSFQGWSKAKLVLFIAGIFFIIMIILAAALYFFTPLKYLFLYKGEAFPNSSSFQFGSGYPNMSGYPSFPSPGGYPNASSLPSGGSASIYPSRNPACVDLLKEYHAQLIYARPSDAPDRYTEKIPILRKWLVNANGILNSEAKQFNITADLKVSCDNGEISVLNVALKTSSDGTLSIGSFVNELKAAGYTNNKTKYIVWYDGVVMGCGGSSTGKCTSTISTKSDDDRLSEDNAYNSGGDFAMIFGEESDLLGPIKMLHEYGHTMGAVQNSAPHSTGEGHCKDEPPIDKGGTDVMCKSDNPSTTFKDSCTGYTFRFDCNNDDYFNPNPKQGSYLAIHWNLGSPLNHFIKFGEINTTEESATQPNYPGFPGMGSYPNYSGGYPSGFNGFPQYPPQ